MAQPAFAQSVPSPALPGQIERQFQQEPQLPKGGAEPMVPQVEQVAPKGAKDVRFVLKGVDLAGIGIFTQDELSPLYASMVGQEVSLADMFAVADRMTAMYRNSGYIVSRVVIPAQSIDDGRVRLQAVEGFIDKVHIVGLADNLQTRVRAYADKIKASRPLTAAALERYMLLINDLPGAFGQATLSPSASTPGAADLTINFSEKKWSALGLVNNRGGRLLGPWWAIGSASANNLFGIHDRTSVQVVASPHRELRYYQLDHEELLGSEGGRLSFRVSSVKAIPEDKSVVPLNVQTKSKTFGLTYTHPVVRSRTQNLYLRGTFLLNNGETTILGSPATTDRIRAARVGVAYDLVDAHNGINILDVEFSKGLTGFGASDNGDVRLSRAVGKVDFTKVSLYGARLQALPGNWSLLAAATGQYAARDLPSSELFAFGGEAFGRAYDPSEKVGDHGAAAKLELRYSDTISLKGSQPYTAYSYYDVGWVRQRTKTASDDNSPTASVGAGLRFGFGPHISGFFEVAKPINKDVTAEGNDNLRGFMGVSGTF